MKECTIFTESDIRKIVQDKILCSKVRIEVEWKMRKLLNKISLKNYLKHLGHIRILQKEEDSGRQSGDVAGHGIGVACVSSLRFASYAFALFLLLGLPRPVASRSLHCQHRQPTFAFPRIFHALNI